MPAWRVIINWDFVSPTLRIATGEVNLAFINSSLNNYKIYESHDFKVDVREDSLSYQEVPTGILTGIMKDTVDTMVQAYFDGVVLKKSSFTWIEKDENNFCKSDYQI